MLTMLITYLGVGAVAGLLAGLLGIGGGLVIVPMLIYILGAHGVPQELVMHMAIGTSMASIMFTSVSSFMAHHKRGAVRWELVRRIVIGILTGSFIGSCFASAMSTKFLKGFFFIFLYVVATNMLLNKKPKPSRELPGRLGTFSVGNIIGGISSIVGTGGGTMNVPFMAWCNVPIHQAIGTSAAIGLPIALASTIGYIVNGLGVDSLPAYSIGYISLPALSGIVLASVLTAPLGVKLAHSLPVGKLKKIFAVLLYVVGTKILIGLI
ncbi:MAG: sulfite exporter TauE/SafE family protein [Desulfobacteraceae bacterium]|nr:sulfite exporter TauE/SafE family protein [Desulfobacteraceae bacterium]